MNIEPDKIYLMAEVRKGMDILKQINANTMGVVYNKVRERELGGYYYRYA